MDRLLLTFGDIPHHGPVLLAWVLLRHTLQLEESSPVIRRIGNTALQLGVFKYISTMLKSLGVSGNNVRGQREDFCIGTIAFSCIVLSVCSTFKSFCLFLVHFLFSVQQALQRCVSMVFCHLLSVLLKRRAYRYITRNMTWAHIEAHCELNHSHFCGRLTVQRHRVPI